MILLYRCLSDLMGCKLLLFGTIIVFLIGLTLCRAAQNMVWIDICWDFQGIRGGSIILLSNIIIGNIVSRGDCSKYSGCIAQEVGPQDVPHV
ncbi:hypothetical protein ACQY0O_004358 [Thecaphora frezii]